MKHYFLKNKIYAFPFEEESGGLDFLTDLQEQFLHDNPQARPHEVRACLLDSDKPVDLAALKVSAKNRIDGMAAFRRESLMPSAKREAAIVVSQLGEDGAISLQVAKDRLTYYNAISTAIQVEKLRIALLIDQASTKQAIEEALGNCHIEEIKTGEERYE